MRFLPTLLPGLLAGALPLVGLAQNTAPAAFKPHFFVALGATIGTYQVPNNFGTVIISPVPTLGVQLSPRLAMQTSMAYRKRSDDYSYSGKLYINGNLQDGITNGNNQRQIVAISILARCTFLRSLERRFQIDLLGGFAAVRSIYRQTNSTTDSSRLIVSSNEYNSAVTGFQFIIGPSLRYRLGQRIDLVNDLAFNTLLNNSSDYYPNRFSSTATLSLRYRFGRS